MKFHSIISSTIGSTPLVRLNRINEILMPKYLQNSNFSIPWAVSKTGSRYR